jgi:hypothetical protein
MGKNILATRQHKLLTERGDQIRTNLLAYHGGAAYIDERLCRWPSESDVDFYGDTPEASETRFLNTGANATIGRKQRAFLVNYAARIAAKINQYVFQSTPTRAGIDPAWSLDITRTGMSLNQFMAEVSSLLTVSRWCWIGVDRPATQGPRSRAEVEASRDRVYWQLYDATEVVDWHFDSRGVLDWLLLEREEYDNADPLQEAKTTTVRYLYRPGTVTRAVFDDKREAFASETALPGAQVIPFTMVGLPSAQPWWFDDVERIMRSIMDLHSSLDTSIFKSVFPLLVVADSFAQAARSDKIDANQVRRKIGTGHPISEVAEESGITRWLSGTTVDLKFIREEIAARGQELYDIVGLAMKMPESRQVASAEAKAWDHLDTEAVLAERATVLEEAELRAIELSRIVGGPIFRPYTPQYAKKFDLSDFVADIQAITQATGLTMPPEGEKLLVKAALRSAAKRFNVGAEDLNAVLKAVDAYEPPVPSFTPPERDAAQGGEDGGDEDGGDGADGNQDQV